jgi:hypothetical protein
VELPLPVNTRDGASTGFEGVSVTSGLTSSIAPEAEIAGVMIELVRGRANDVVARAMVASASRGGDG